MANRSSLWFLMIALLALIFLTFPRVTVAGNGIFNSPRCLAALESMNSEQNKNLLMEAVQNGALTREDIEEYINRKYRLRYLVSELDRYNRALEMAKSIFKSLQHANFLAEFPVLTRKQTLAVTARRLAQKWAVGDEITVAEKAPLSIDLLSIEPPMDARKMRKAEKLLTLATVLASYRYEVSVLFTRELPLSQPIPSYPEDLLKEYAGRATHRLEQNLRGRHDILPLLAARDTNDAESLLTKVLSSLEVPRSFRDELAIQADFERKYHLNRHPLHLAFCEATAEYFGIE